MGDASNLDFDFDFSFTAAKYAWKLGTKIGSELGRLADGNGNTTGGSGGDSPVVMRHIDYGHLPRPFFDYGRF